MAARRPQLDRTVSEESALLRAKAWVVAIGSVGMDGAGLGAGTSSNTVAAMRFEKAFAARVLVAEPGLFFAPEGNRSRAAWHLMFVPSEALEEFTGLKRPSAQKRFLDVLGIKNIERLDGSLAVRQEEIDAHTLSKPPKDSKRRRTLNLSLLSKTG